MPHALLDARGALAQSPAGQGRGQVALVPGHDEPPVFVWKLRLESHSFRHAPQAAVRFSSVSAEKLHLASFPRRAGKEGKEGEDQAEGARNVPVAGPRLARVSDKREAEAVSGEQLPEQRANGLEEEGFASSFPVGPALPHERTYAREPGSAHSLRAQKCDDHHP